MNMEIIDLLRKISSRLGWILFILLLPFIFAAFWFLSAAGLFVTLI